jgi:hypothetical protein
MVAKELQGARRSNTHRRFDAGVARLFAGIAARMKSFLGWSCVTVTRRT